LIPLTLSLFCLGHPLPAQHEESPCFKIAKIEVNGNIKTKDYIILREMRLKPGDCVRLRQIEEDRKRLQNLGLFTRVEMKLKQSPQGIILIVNVTERWYFFPFPILFINERDWSKLSYGAGMVNTNFRGRGESLQTAFWLGYNPGVVFRYFNRWFGDHWRLFTSLDLFKIRVRSRSLQVESFDEERRGISWVLGRRFDYYTYLSIGLGYQLLSVSPPVEGRTLSPSGRDHLPAVELIFKYDSRDLWEYPHKGWNIKIWGKKTGWKGMEANYSKYGLDIRRYLPLTTKTTLALRGKTVLSRGRIPIYDRVFLGYEERIRGYFNRRSEGENLLLGMIELRFPLKGISYFTWESAPFLKDYFRNLKFGISAGIFLDTGDVWFQNQQLRRRRFHTGFGFGLHFHLPYIDLLRLEYALNEDLKGEIISEVGVAF